VVVTVVVIVIVVVVLIEVSTLIIIIKQMTVFHITAVISLLCHACFCLFLNLEYRHLQWVQLTALKHFFSL